MGDLGTNLRSGEFTALAPEIGVLAPEMGVLGRRDAHSMLAAVAHTADADNVSMSAHQFPQLAATPGSLSERRKQCDRDAGARPEDQRYWNRPAA
ncbi:hypothetical protein EDF56_105338 [Novosphingobium sp. PhB165]|nr:hypothetical protein EDF56_105338 [Novosphingobium sp. PhB165]